MYVQEEMRKYAEDLINKTGHLKEVSEEVAVQIHQDSRYPKRSLRDDSYLPGMLVYTNLFKDVQAV